MPHKGKTGTSVGGLDSSPERRKGNRRKRKRKEERWAAKSGPVIVRRIEDEPPQPPIPDTLKGPNTVRQGAEHPIMMDNADQAARALARWLAPYLADELGIAPAPSKQLVTGVSESYDDATCAAYVSALGPSVLETARIFFGLLAVQDEVGSLALAKAIGVPSPRNIPGVLTTPLKKRAKTLRLPYPWREDTEGERIIWFDREETSRRMVEAIEGEQARRAARGAA